MLLRFGVENYRSFRDYAELSFVATKLRDAPLWRIPADGVPTGLLPVLGVYGANASGKSNLLKALDALVAHVGHSFADLKPGQAIPWTPWRLNRGEGSPLTRLDIDFLVDGVRHHYGFRFNSVRFEEEWLFRWPKGTRQVIFHRDHREAEPWSFGRELRGAKRLIADSTRPNSLFLSAAAHLNHDDLGRVAAAITEQCRPEAPIELSGHPLFEQTSPLLHEGHRPTVRRLLASADLGVRDLSARPVPEARKAILDHLRATVHPDAFDEVSKQFESEEPPVEVWLKHGADDADSWELPPAQESRGTHVLLARLHDLLHVLTAGGLLMLDEIDTSLHPEICAALVGLFTGGRTNPHGAQLLFTTHDRSLLSSLRRDEVVLVDKTPDGASSLRVASDFRGVRARDDLRRAHEQGRLGGVPVLGDFAGEFARVREHGA